MERSNTTEKTAILLACRNGEAFIAEQIESILLQSEENWELFIHDDGSADQTMVVCLQYAAKFPDKIHVIDGEPTGSAAANFFYLLQQVRAPYYMFCDQDDYWKKEKLARSLQIMKEAEADGEPVLLFSDLEVVDENLNMIDSSMNRRQDLNPQRTSFRQLMIQNCITGCSVMINNALADLMRRPCNTDNVIMHDWWAGLIASFYGRIIYIPETLVRYRQHGRNSIGSYKSNSFSYLKAKLFRKNEIHDSLLATQNQVGEFINTFGISDENLKTYASLYQLPRRERQAFYRDYQVSMQGRLRNLGLKLFG